MTHACTDVYYHSRHTALVLFLFIFSYLYSFYQCYLFCQPFLKERNKKLSIFSFNYSEMMQILFFALSFTMTISIDYYLIRPSFGVSLMIFLYYAYERYSSKFNLFIFLFMDFLGFLFIFYLQDGCFVKILVVLRILLEAFKLVLTLWANNFLKIHKTGGVHIIGACILVSWIFFFMLRR